MSLENNSLILPIKAKPVNPFALILLTLLTGVIFSVLMFPIAQDWAWIEAWIFITIFLIIYLGNVLSLNQRNPEVIRNRMRAKKEKLTSAGKTDKYILPLLGLCMILSFILPSFNHRYRWTSVPMPMELLGFCLITVGFLLIFRSMSENAYASKVLDIRKDQQVIDTGVYAYVRHPMYSGFAIMIIGVPLGLGDWWSLIPGILTGVILYIRSIFEEKMLIDGLSGYSEYMKKVKKRLIPFVL